MGACWGAAWEMLSVGRSACNRRSRRRCPSALSPCECADHFPGHPWLGAAMPFLHRRSDLHISLLAHSCGWQGGARLKGSTIAIPGPRDSLCAAMYLGTSIVALLEEVHREVACLLICSAASIHCMHRTTELNARKVHASPGAAQ